jgi:hypothetical protein
MRDICTFAGRRKMQTYLKQGNKFNNKNMTSHAMRCENRKIEKQRREV